MNPKLAWKRVRELEAGLTGHHKCPKTTRFKNTEGNEASNDCEEADNASEHFKKVYTIEATHLSTSQSSKISSSGRPSSN
jgi:hypothetical protein